MDKHKPECRWEKTTPEQCEYKDTHHYCPHEEHACNCADLPQSNGDLMDTGRNPDGTFKEGHGFGKGRITGSRNFATIYKEALKKIADKNNLTPEEIEDEMIANGILSARKGNYNFYKDVLDRLHGQATKRIVGDIDITNREKVDDPVISKIAEDINELYKRTGGHQGANSGGDGAEASPVGTKA